MGKVENLLKGLQLSEAERKTVRVWNPWERTGAAPHKAFGKLFSETGSSPVGD
jgi:hypothetical protein